MTEYKEYNEPFLVRVATGTVLTLALTILIGGVAALTYGIGGLL